MGKMGKMGKREHETSLSGGVVGDKTNPIVELRGRLDSLSADIVELQILGELQGLASLIDDLEEVKSKVYDILYCEVTGEECAAPLLWGMDSDELRERSHHPERYFGLGHIRPHHTMGVAAAGLNSLRTRVRETELAACRAFGAERPDIILALNRLSSALYVLTYKYLPAGYDKITTFSR
jgi:ethanolamine utilization cobalamin adenosyltransferase